MDLSGISHLAAALADPTRAGMCAALLDRRAWTVSELARYSGVAVSTASEHLKQLDDAGLVERVRQGRHSYTRLKDERTAALLELMSAQSVPAVPATLKGSRRLGRLAFARTCYDHLAGSVGVGLRDGMLRSGLVRHDDGPTLTDSGRAVLTELGVEMPTTRSRPLLRECLDWTERREHLAGAVPAAVLGVALERGWIVRRDDRSVQVTDAAGPVFSRLGLQLERLGAERDRRTG